MPVPKLRKGEAQKAFVGRCISQLTKEDPNRPEKQIQAICFDTFRRSKESGENMIIENLPLKFSSPFTVITEGKEPIDGQRKIRGTMLLASTSRNGRKYTIEAIQNATFSGQNISVNHSEDVMDNVGHFEPVLKGDSILFEGTVFDTKNHPGITDMVDKRLINFVSIEALAEKVSQDKQGNVVIEGGLDITGLGMVKTPGFPEATMAIAEAFEKAKGDVKGKEVENMKDKRLIEEEEKEEEEEEKTPQEEEEMEEKPAEEAPAEEETKEEEKEEEPAEEKTEEKLSKEVISLKEKITKLEKRGRGIVTNAKESTPVMEVVIKGRPGEKMIYPKYPEKAY